MIIYCFTSHSRIFYLYGDVTIAGEGLQNLKQTNKPGKNCLKVKFSCRFLTGYMALHGKHEIFNDGLIKID
jgi:hypothetical protein